MVKMNLLQHIIYFVVKLGPLIQTPFCGSKQLSNFMLSRKLIFFCHPNSFNGEKGVTTTNYIFCGKAWPFDPNLFCGSKQLSNFMLSGKLIFFCHQNSFNGEKGLITTNYIFCGIDPNLFL